MKRANRSPWVSLLAAICILAGCANGSPPNLPPGLSAAAPGIAHAFVRGRSLAARAPRNSVSRVEPLSAAYTLLYAFTGEPDGAYPSGNVTAFHGALYGVTTNGGTGDKYPCQRGCGTVFTVGAAGERIVHTFAGPPGDGASPESALIDAGGTLYGTTAEGGLYDRGTIYTITPSGTEKILYSFGRNVRDGLQPTSNLTNVDGVLYGTTYRGGSSAYCCGTVFAFTPSGRARIIYRFGTSNDAELPDGAVTDVGGTLYGTTQYGGEYDRGTIYSITRSGEETIVHSFGAPGDGNGPSGSLMDVNGTFYGTTEAGGAPEPPPCQYGCGTVYSITPSGKETILHSFVGSPYDGSYPNGSLTRVNGAFYGSSRGGAVQLGGTVFAIERTSGHEWIVHDFPFGSAPNPLINVKGTLYGTTRAGNYEAHDGAVFSLAPR